MNAYRWAFAGPPFAPAGLVMKGDAIVVRLDYEAQDEKLLVARLSEIVRTLERVDRKLGRKP